MTQIINDFVRERTRQQPSELDLAMESKPGWDVLKNLVSQFAFDNYGIGGRKFRWSRSPAGPPRLSLGNAAATLSDGGQQNGIPQNCTIKFSCIAITFAAGSAFPQKTWSLTPEIVRGQFAWSIREIGRTFSPGQLAHEIAMELTRYYLSYEARPVLPTLSKIPSAFKKAVGRPGSGGLPDPGPL